MKKKIFHLMMVLVILNSCNNPSSQYNNRETLSAPDTIGYYAARNMKGLASFKIGESTYSATIKLLKEEIRQDNRRYKETNHKELPKYSGYQERYLDFTFDKNGNVASHFYREDFGSIYEEIQYDTLSSFLVDDFLERKIFGCPDLKELKLFKYYIGDIEINSLRACLNLVA